MAAPQAQITRISWGPRRGAGQWPQGRWGPAGSSRMGAAPPWAQKGWKILPFFHGASQELYLCLSYRIAAQCLHWARGPIRISRPNVLHPPLRPLCPDPFMVCLTGGTRNINNLQSKMLLQLSTRCFPQPPWLRSEEPSPSTRAGTCARARSGQSAEGLAVQVLGDGDPGCATHCPDENHLSPLSASLGLPVFARPCSTPAPNPRRDCETLGPDLTLPCFGFFLAMQGWKRQPHAKEGVCVPGQRGSG